MTRSLVNRANYRVLLGLDATDIGREFGAGTGNAAILFLGATWLTPPVVCLANYRPLLGLSATFRGLVSFLTGLKRANAFIGVGVGSGVVIVFGIVVSVRELADIVMRMKCVRECRVATVIGPMFGAVVLRCMSW